VQEKLAWTIGKVLKFILESTKFTHKSSFNYDLLRAKVFRWRKETYWTNSMQWIAFVILGVFMGFTASIIVFIEEHLTDFKRDTAEKILIAGSTEGIFTSWAFFTLFSMVLVFLASAMTVYYAPGANGSGVAELIAIMNGINYPGVFSFAVYLTKSLAVVGAVVGGLTIGKEGPMAHIGACIGCSVAYLPFKDFEFMRNDKNKRVLIAAGTSAGVSAAFGAPIGGTLFAYEMSKPNTFWDVKMLWRVFVCCACAVFSLAFFSTTWKVITGGGGNILDMNSSSLKFGVVQVTAPTLKIIPACIIVGALGGLLGAFFVIINN
jgi:chloride channel 7